MTPSTIILDHIIHLSPGHTLDGPLNEFKDLGFNVIPGGTHTDGVSSNVLVILQDGVYVELLIFNHPNPPPHHWWGSRAPGWIDLADLGTDDDLHRVINDRYRPSDVHQVVELYKPPSAGGRIARTPEGVERELKWRITQPDARYMKGELPFFCEDLTPREWRVPHNPPSNTVHPNGVLGVSSLTYLAPSSVISSFSEQLTAVYGFSPSTTSPSSGNQVKQYTWTLQPPTPLLQPRTSQALPAELHLRETDAHNDEEVRRGTGLYEVAFWVSGKSGVAKSQYGRIKFISVNDA